MSSNWWGWRCVTCPPVCCIPLYPSLGCVNKPIVTVCIGRRNVVTGKNIRVNRKITRLGGGGGGGGGNLLKVVCQAFFHNLDTKFITVLIRRHCYNCFVS
jgi:hypothetical protein